MKSVNKKYMQSKINFEALPRNPPNLSSPLFDQVKTQLREEILSLILDIYSKSKIM